MACGTDMRRDDVSCGRSYRILLLVFRRTTPLFLHTLWRKTRSEALSVPLHPSSLTCSEESLNVFPLCLVFAKAVEGNVAGTRCTCEFET